MIQADLLHLRRAIDNAMVLGPIFNMADAPHLTRARRAEHAATEERLARALRENLHRRKAQSRAQAEADRKRPEAEDEPPA